MHENTFVIDHPLIKHKLSILRDKTTTMENFRKVTQEISFLLYYEATKNLPTITKTIETPLESMQAEILAEREPIVIPIMRSGLAMLDAFLKLFPGAKVGFVGLRRNESTLVSEEYYYKIPLTSVNCPIFVIDPMLATGGSAIACMTRLKKKNMQNIRLINIIAAPEGIKNFHAKFPEIPIYTAVIDRALNQHSYIVPGLGDAGDRLYGTE